MNIDIKELTKTWQGEESNPKLVVLNFSGGKQSSCILWMLIREEIPRPDNLIVLNADPGMENSNTYKYLDMMKKECEKSDIYFERVDGPSLYKDLTSIPDGEITRIDNPPYWTKGKNRRTGQLMQACTFYYKIAPMLKSVRRILEEKYGISRNTKHLGKNVVCQWIGFSKDEASRVKPSRRKYLYFAYPLITLGYSTEDVLNYFKERNLPIPERSVCNACFANGLNTLKEMYENRPQDWEQAVEVDNAVRDMSKFGIEEDVYVSNTLIPLQQLPKNNFTLGDGKDSDGYSCDSGYCFT